MLALLYEKGAIDNQVEEIEFGTDVANVDGLVLNVSLQNLFFRAQSIQKRALRSAIQSGTKIQINLAKLQKEILKVPLYLAAAAGKRPQQQWWPFLPDSQIHGLSAQ